MKYLFYILLAIPLACGAGVSKEKIHSEIDASIAKVKSELTGKRRDYFAKHRSESIDDISFVTSTLQFLVSIDMDTRSYWSSYGSSLQNPDEKKYFLQHFLPVLRELDAGNLLFVKEAVAKYGWLKISIFGERADYNAWLIVQHADYDTAFQASVLGALSTLYPHGETNKTTYAYLYDRVKVNAGNEQRYGTQIQRKLDASGRGYAEPYPFEDRSIVDNLRQEMELKPVSFDEYFKVTQKMCEQMMGKSST